MQSAIFYIDKISNRRYEFHQVYRTTNTSQLIHSEYGISRDGTFQKTSQLSALEDRRNLYGLQLVAGTVLNNPNSHELYRNYSYVHRNSDFEKLKL